MNDVTKNEKKEKKRDSLSIIVLILLLLMTVTVGYSIVSTNLTINGSTVLKRSEWNVHLDNLKVVNGSEFLQSGPTITTNGTIVTFAVGLDKVNDTFEFTVDVYNEGTIDAKLSNVLKSGLTTEQEEYVEYDITKENGSPLGVGDVLAGGERTKVKVRVKYIKLFPINEDDLTDTHEDVSLVFKLDYVQN